MKVRFFAHLQTFTGCDAIEISGMPSMTPDELWTHLEKIFPGIIQYKSPTRLARNCAYADAGSVFKTGDEIALIPPVSGG